MNWEAIKGALKFGTDPLNQQAIIDVINDMRGLGIRAFRFVRQVPPTPSYPKGVSSTQWLDLKSYSPKKLKHLIGGMMQPGIDYVRHMMILEDDVHKLPQPMRSQALDAISKA